MYGLNIKLTAYKVGKICKSQWYRVPLNKGSLLWHPMCPMVSKQKCKLKIMGSKTARSNYLSPLLSKANYSTCGTNLILRYLLWSLSPFSSCSVCTWVLLSLCKHSQVYPIWQPIKARYSFFHPASVSCHYPSNSVTVLSLLAGHLSKPSGWPNCPVALCFILSYCRETYIASMSFKLLGLW